MVAHLDGTFSSNNDLPTHTISPTVFPTRTRVFKTYKSHPVKLNNKQSHQTHLDLQSLREVTDRFKGRYTTPTVWQIMLNKYSYNDDRDQDGVTTQNEDKHASVIHSTVGKHHNKCKFYITFLLSRIFRRRLPFGAMQGM